MLFWLVLFLWRKDARKEMLVMSLMFGVAGLLVELTYVQDWWKPLTITNTIVGIEDFIFGFVIGGIAAVIYEEIFKKRIRKRKLKDEKKDILFFIFALILPILFYSSFYLFKFNTLISSIIGLGIPTLIIYIRRKDLIIDSLASGFLLLIIAVIVYTILEFLTPGWVLAFWYFKDIPNIVILNVPLNDFIWYILAGIFIGPLYEFWQEGRLVNKKR